MQIQRSARTPATRSRFAYVLLTLFSLPFIGGGALALFQGIRRFGSGRDAIILMVVGGVFMAAGLLLAGGVWFGASAAAKKEALQEQYPGKPWMWREEWANRVITDSNRGSAIGMWIFAFFWNAISFPIAVLAVPDGLAQRKPAVLVVLLFPLIGIGVLIAAIYMTLRSMRFGTSKCHLDTVPIVPGRRFRGDIEVGIDTPPENGYRIRVSSIHAVTTRSGKNSSTTEHVLWDDEIVVAAGAAMRGANGTRVPFELATPPDGHTTDESDSNSRFFWRLSASAEFPGVDYAAQFQLPLFQTGEAVDGSEYAAFEQRHRADAARHQLPASSGVRITPQIGGGEQFLIRARKTLGGTLGALLFLVIWNAALVALIHFGAPAIASLIFVAIDLLIILSTVDYFFGITTVTVDTTGVKVRREWLGYARTSSHDAATIASIDAGSVGGSNSAFAVTLKLGNGGTATLSNRIPDRESADTVAAKMMADLRPA